MKAENDSQLSDKTSHNKSNAQAENAFTITIVDYISLLNPQNIHIKKEYIEKLKTTIHSIGEQVQIEKNLENKELPFSPKIKI